MNQIAAIIQRPKVSAIAACVVGTFLMLCWPVMGQAKPPEHWLESGYAYNAKNTPVEKILKDFADSFGVSLKLSPGIRGSSDGWSRASNAVEFLDRLAVKYKLQWFVYSEVLYVSPISDNVIERIEISQDGAVDLKRALKGVGLLEEKFGWGEITDEGAILLSGPKKYVSLVRSLVKMKKKEKESREEIMVFPLKHAAVEDREIYIREERIVIPGVASVLRNLLERKRGSNQNDNQNASIDTLRTMADSAETRLDKSPWQRQKLGTGTGSQSSRGKGVRVEADVRTNSVLIHDSTERKGYYQKLIETLDTPQNLIEIEAIIVDIDRSKLKDLGVDWQYLNNGRGIASNISGIGQNPVSQFNNGNATMLISDIDRFYASLRALESQGEASVIANPSVLTLENQPAVIDLSETAYIETVGERVANVIPVTAGTMLRVIPRQVRDENQRIQLIVDIEDGRIIQNSPDDLPRVQRNTIATKAVIDRDYSLVVGGYHIQEVRKNKNKIPLMSDIPIVGEVFTSTTDDYSQRERLFILTPHISANRHNPAAYSRTGEGQRIDESIQQVASRREQASQDRLTQIRALFKHLAQEQLPNGYELTAQTPSTTCSQNGVKFDFSHGRTISGAGLEVHIGTVVNDGRDMIEVSEAACDSRGVLAVAIWPGSTLQKGQKAEVFVAREPGQSAFNRLPSLIK